MSKIAVDMDGTLAAFPKGFITLLNKLHGTTADVNHQPGQWNWMGPEQGFTDAQVDAGWRFIGDHPEFWFQLEPLPGAIDMLDVLREKRLQHEIYFLTVRFPSPAAKHWTEKWLAWHGFENPTVVIADNKGIACRGLAIDLMIEDCPFFVDDIARFSPQTNVWLVAWRWNEGLPNMRGTPQEIAKWLRKL